MAYIINASSTPEVEQLQRAGYKPTHLTLGSGPYSLEAYADLTGGGFDAEDHQECGYDLVPFGHPEWKGYILLYVDCDARHLLYHGLIDGLRENGHDGEATKIEATGDKSTW